MDANNTTKLDKMLAKVISKNEATKKLEAHVAIQRKNVDAMLELVRQFEYHNRNFNETNDIVTMHRSLLARNPNAETDDDMEYDIHRHEEAFEFLKTFEKNINKLYYNR